jgi:AcrR family transcriptional regulator
LPADKEDVSVNASPIEILVKPEVSGVKNEQLIQTRRAQICDAALELFLEKGIASTTIRDICARSGVNQASIYDYIENKNDILRRLLNQLWFRPDVPTLPERLEAFGDADFEDILTSYFRDTWRIKRKGTLLAYRSIPHLQSDDRKAMRAHDTRLITLLARHLRERTGLPADDKRPEIVANLIIFLTAFGPMRDWVQRDIDEELMAGTIAAGVTAMLEHLKAQGEPPST